MARQRKSEAARMDLQIKVWRDGFVDASSIEEQPVWH